MKIKFDDKSYIEVQKTQDNKYLIIIQAKDSSNSRKNITNVCELTFEQFQSLFNSIKE